MSETKAKTDNTVGSSGQKDATDKPMCGLIMPISATENHDEAHWAAVQTLLHRGIRAAGLTPSNVWEGVNDRISKRIVSNIFRQEIVVADISDLNPNVMLELGLRLASKKPTIVVFNKGGRIPFDISDVEALPYPHDLNILEMEIFLSKFAKLIEARLSAYRNHTYEPFLADVVVEVLEPQTKQVSIDSVLLERMEDMVKRINSIDARLRTTGRSTSANGGRQDGRGRYFWVPQSHKAEFDNQMRLLELSWRSLSRPDLEFYYFNELSESERSAVRALASAVEGGSGAPASVMHELEVG